MVKFCHHIAHLFAFGHRKPKPQHDKRRQEGGCYKTAVIGQNQTINEWQVEQLVKDGRIYLEMIDAKQSAKGNWVSFFGGGNQLPSFPLVVMRQ